MPRQGWKLHVSAYVWTARDVLSAALPVVVGEGVAWKLLADQRYLLAVNRGDGGTGQVGKLLTVYPADDRQFGVIAARLVDALEGLTGPIVLSDRRVATGTPVFYRYGVFGSRMVQTETGEVWSALEGPTGDLVPDRRPARDHVPAWVEDPIGGRPADVEQTVPLGPPASGNGIGRFVPVHLVHRSARSVLQLGIDTDGLRPCLVKRYLAAGEDRAEGATERMEREHAAITRLRSCPGTLDVLWCEPGRPDRPDAVLVSNYLPACTLGQALRDRSPDQRLEGPGFADWARSLAGLVAALHEHDVVHGDLKSANVLISVDDELHLVDYESASLAGSATLGARPWTRGYFPTASIGARPAKSDDVYALGALMYLMATGVEPSLSPVASEPLRRPIALLAPELPSRTASLIEACLAPSARDRPSAGEVVRALDEPASSAVEPGPVVADRGVILNAARALGDHLAAVASDERSQCGTPAWSWSSRHLLGKGRVLLDVNTGVAGTLLGLAEVVAAFGDPVHRARLAGGARWLMQAAPIEGPLRPGLGIGRIGVAMALLRTGTILADEEITAYGLSEARTTASVSYANPDLFHGTAGRLLGHLACWRLSHDERDLAHAYAAGDALLTTARPNPSSRSGSACWWELPPGFQAGDERPLLGYAHGAAGVADALLHLAAATGIARYAEVASAALAWVAGQAVTYPDGSIGWPAVSGGQPRPPHWCHGAAGISRALLHAHRAGILDAGDLLQGTARSLATTARWSGPTFCHGLAGMIDALIDLRPFAADVGIDRALGEMTALLFAFGLDGGRAGWITGTPDIVTPDLLVGEAGVAAVLLRLADPNRPALMTLEGFAPRSVSAGQR